jgi:hypothetical protein
MQAQLVFSGGRGFCSGGKGHWPSAHDRDVRRSLGVLHDSLIQQRRSKHEGRHPLRMRGVAA